MARKQACQVTLTNGEKIIVSKERGEAARRAMAGSGLGIWSIPEQNNRMVKATIIGEVNDVWVEDVQVQLGEQLATARRLEAARTGDNRATPTSPGYIYFLMTEVWTKAKRGAKHRRPLTQEQVDLIVQCAKIKGKYDEYKNSFDNLRANTSPEEQQATFQE